VVEILVWLEEEFNFIDFASHEAFRVCKISQCLQTKTQKTQCDHNESKKH
jgi:hypothetical protein